MNWGAFGEITFKTGFAPKSLKESKTYSYRVHKPVKSLPLYDFTGKDEENLEIQITLSRAFVKVSEALRKFEEYAESAEPKTLVIGKTYMGEYIIRSLEKVYEEILPSGEIFQVSLTLKLSKVPKSEV